MPAKNSFEAGDGRYMIVNIVARRARDINKKLFQSTLPEESVKDPLDMALTEYHENLLQWEFRDQVDGPGDDFRSN